MVPPEVFHRLIVRSIGRSWSSIGKELTMPDRLDNFASAMVDCFGDRAHDVAAKVALEAVSSEQSVHEVWLAVVTRIADLHPYDGLECSRLKKP